MYGSQRFWPRFYIVVLGMTFFFLRSHLISIFYLDFYIPFLFGHFFPFSIWTFISIFYLDFYFPFLFGLLFPFSIWTFISLFYLDFYFETFQDISRHFKTFRETFRYFSIFFRSFQSRSDFGFLPNFFCTIDFSQHEH